MATATLTGTRLPWCRSCLHRLAGPGFQQVRGKKRLNTVKVRLLEDIALFGPQGSVLEVARGRMRNLWFPRKQAEYITREMELKTGKVGVVARDPTFDPETAKAQREVEKKKVAILARILPGSKAIPLLEHALPKSVHFYRATTSPDVNTLCGSVNKAEIATALKTIAAAKNPADGSRISLTRDNIDVVGVKGDKVTNIGKYELRIHMKDAQTVVRRQLLVTREDDDAADITPTKRKAEGTSRSPSAATVEDVSKETTATPV